MGSTLNSDAVVYGIKQKKKLKESHKRSREDNETGIPYIHDDQTVIKKKKKILLIHQLVLMFIRSEMGQ